ncbi:uncharacterized protein FIBRA_02440 [Fibroporia radiculosa]|uniref:Spindle pole body component n=1 Tax=Fibroporia radiculosa TaxID=599839 RepID=J4GMV9_9APHY|nr:uncharacterized protein FIBRA_02440 [Fibroporia radiculosa]CCM00410.1 predicted protein [Fibroporia radiculosa]
MEVFTSNSFILPPRSEYPPIHPIPEIHPTFFIPRLAKTPPNPILDSLAGESDKPKRLTSDNTFSHESPISRENARASPDVVQQQGEHSWDRSTSQEHSAATCILSWDALRLPFNTIKNSPGILSQQTSQAFASVRYYIRPPFRDPRVRLLYVDAEALFQSLKSLLFGVSSALHIWDPRLETFILKGIPSGMKGVIVLTGIDEAISSSLLERFMNIGTLSRRLENTLDQKSRTVPVYPIIHSFNHALSSILMYLRHYMTNVCLSPLQDARHSAEPLAKLLTIWMDLNEVEEVLHEIFSLCGQARTPNSTPGLLSRVYECLGIYLERRSSPLVAAILAYILTICSEDFFLEACKSVGYVSTRRSETGASAVGILDGDNFASPFTYSDHHSDIDYGSCQDSKNQEIPPSFMKPGLVDALSRARRSLKLLQQADPNHALFRDVHNHRTIGWIWREDEISAAWADGLSRPKREYKSQAPTALSSDTDFGVSRAYMEALQQFAVFDGLPGTHIQSTATSSTMTASSQIHLFVENFPRSLPALTPTLSHLTDLVFLPLAEHADSLSGALVSLFLSSTHLNFRLHLVLLRSYLLLTSHSFKVRLSAALFSDSDDNPQTSRGHPSSNSTSAQAIDHGSQRWAVGLSPNLTNGDIWPPGGADLRFHLRTVIIDTLEDAFKKSLRRQFGEGTITRVIREAEHRLGFAIRDLPTGTGKEAWLDPSSIEALDFLYLDYQPPKPLDVLITPGTISKYHRMFAFQLRLMRVHSVIATIFRLTRKASHPLFPTLARSNELLIHFRFVTHSFVLSLSSYLYDRVIAGTFDAFLDKLRPPSQDATPSRSPAFSDVFSLAESHSQMMDDILSACLLRSGQKSVGDLLRGCLDIVVEFGILAGERYMDRLPEYRAAVALENVWNRFRNRISTLVKVLKALVQKGSGYSHLPAGPPEPHLSNNLGDPSRYWHDLLTRLDTTDWWDAL